MTTVQKKPRATDPDVDRDQQDNKKRPNKDAGATPQDSVSNDAASGTIKIGS